MQDDRLRPIPGNWQRHALFSAITASLAAGGSGVALAQTGLDAEADNAAGELEEVMVTARKREENIQDIPSRSRPSASRRSTGSVSRACRMWRGSYPR